MGKLILLGLVCLSFGTTASAGPFSIIPTWGSTIAADTTANQTAIKGTIMSAIALYEAAFSDPITVHITFEEGVLSGGDIGESSTNGIVVSYSQYLTALTADRKTANDNTAVASLPVQAGNPVGNSGSVVILTTADARALGFNAPAPSISGVPTDGTVSLSTTLMNLSRPDADPNKYDLMAVAMHEIDEVLAFGSGLDFSYHSADPNFNVRAQDLFRYSAAGTRSYTTSSSASAYFSINGGITNLDNFNQSGTGDYGDWASSASPQVQDAFGSHNQVPDLGMELTELDILGFDETSPTVPEPASMLLLGSGLLALAARLRRK